MADISTSQIKLFIQQLLPVGQVKEYQALGATLGMKYLQVDLYGGLRFPLMEVLEEVKVQKKDDDALLPEKRESGPRIMYKKEIPAHLKKLRSHKPSSSLLGRSSDDESSNKRLNKSDKSSDYDSPGFSSDPDSFDSDSDQPYIIINKTNQKFDQAIIHIKKESVIGVAMEGVCIGRQGKLCWLQVATRDCIFLFDVLTMQKSCFEHGLQDILEDEDILKVIHDCRFPSDILYHQYNIHLCNVFDTQVAQVFVYRLHTGKGDWPRYVEGLAGCLLDHLDISKEQIHTITVRQNYKKEDQEIWAQRPTPKPLLDLAMKNVMYLRELRVILMEKMLAEYVAGVDVYLTQVRGASQEDAKKYQSQRHLLPVVFEELPNLMAKKNDIRFRKNSRDITRQKDPRGFIENYSKIANSKIIFSSDSVWHTLDDNAMPSHKSVIDSRIKHKERNTATKPSVKQPNSNDEMSVENMKSKPIDQSKNLQSFAPVNLNLNKKSYSDTENEPVGSVIRRLINKTTNSENDAQNSDDDFVFKPAGEMQPQGIDQKKRRRQQEKFESINIINEPHSLVQTDSLVQTGSVVQADNLISVEPEQKYGSNSKPTDDFRSCPELAASMNQILSSSLNNSTEILPQAASTEVKQNDMVHSHGIVGNESTNHQPFLNNYLRKVPNDEHESPISSVDKPSQDNSTSPGRRVQEQTSPPQNGQRLLLLNNGNLNAVLKNTTNRMDRLNLLREALIKQESNS